ncbi:hypothetical protein CYY_003434 [Polysphondylium violaceum]|uniref:JmjC domain-containing protein n=1 Tax=Polysphondylium violaceum TaxID=133409 RepID=A0A8J4PUR3_9MYCE|nr:hypothetical protein CYY_003434 [Polysphondylium violaceum]
MEPITKDIESDIEDEEIEEYVPHPYGVKPQGNYYFDSLNQDFVDSRKIGLGIFQCLEDSFIIDSILDLLSERDLCNIVNRISKAFYLLVQEEEPWKMRCINRFSDGNFTFAHNWQYTFKFNASKKTFNVIPKPIQVKYFYSDFLFHIWRCTSVDLKRWEEGDTIDRKTNLSWEDFTANYLVPNKPVIISDAAKDWKAKNWTRESLIEKCGDVKLYVNSGVFMNVKEFFNYSANVQEEMPMYLFDHYYGEKVPEILDEYTASFYFREDFFSVLGDKRPSFRWLLAGPARSGASFHKDPNHTSAWNTVITGRKKWVMYPPHITPPGVYPSDDGLEVTAPSSIVEWFVNFYEKDTDKDDMDQQDDDEFLQQQKENEKKQTRFKINNKRKGNNIQIKQKQEQQQQQEQETYETVKPLEGILHPGEMIFVPTGWWHTVINLEESIAITHNFVDSHNVLKVIEFLKTKKKRDLHDEFVKKFQEAHPGLLEKLIQQKEEKEQEEMDKIAKKKKSLWESTTTDDNNQPNTKTFSFSFSFNDNDDGDNNADE